MVVKTDSADRATTAAEATKGRLAGTRNALPAHEKRAVVAPSGKNTHTAPPARTSSVLRLPLQALVDEFLYEVDETLAAGTYRAYAVPLSLFVRYLRKSLAHEPLLADLTVETARSWSQMLRERPKQLRGGQAEGNSPISLASRRNDLRHLRAFANWLTKPPHHYLDDSPLRHYKLPRGEETAKVPVERDALRTLRKPHQAIDGGTTWRHPYAAISRRLPMRRVRSRGTC